MKPTTMLSGGLIGVAVAEMWLCSQSAQLTVNTVGDRPGPATTDLVGVARAPELTSIAPAMVAALFATTILGSIGRRIVGGFTALLAIAVSWVPMTLPARGEEGADSQRVLDLLASGGAIQRVSSAAIVAD